MLPYILCWLLQEYKALPDQILSDIFLITVQKRFMYGKKL